MKTKLKKDMKRLDEHTLALLNKKQRIRRKKNRKQFNRVKKQLNFDDEQNGDESNKTSILLVVSAENEDRPLTDEEVMSNKHTYDPFPLVKNRS